MFDWFSSTSNAGETGLEQMRAEFGQMLDAGRHVFDTAANAFLGGTDLGVIRDDLFATDKRINKAEQKIRKEIVIHASVHGATVFPACLVLMSVVKDAERVGDYAKNLFDLAELTPHPPEGEYKADLIQLKDRISSQMALCREAFDRQDKEQSNELIAESELIEDHCDAQIAKVLSNQDGIMPATYALAYRYFKRACSHVLNVATSVVQPVHKIDYTSTKPSASEQK